MTLSPTAERALAAYGGRERWADATAVEATLSVGGLAFLMKWQRPFRQLHVRAEIARPYSRLQPIDRHGHVGVLDGHAVRLEDESGQVLESRDNPRSNFPYGRRAIYWDVLDQTYFSGYAAWNYLTLPALLVRDDIAWTEVTDSTLEARFPPSIPTHCAVQRFHFDTSGLLHGRALRQLGARGARHPRSRFVGRDLVPFAAARDSTGTRRPAAARPNAHLDRGARLAAGLTSAITRRRRPPAAPRRVRPARVRAATDHRRSRAIHRR